MVFCAGSEPAVEVVKNNDLTALRMPNLKWVSKEGAAVRVRIMNNAELSLSDEEIERIEKAAGGSSHVQITITESELIQNRWVPMPHVKHFSSLHYGMGSSDENFCIN